MTSVREGGSSIADIAKHAISARAKIFFSLFVWLALILVISVFAYLCADTFIKEPKIVIPSLGLIPIAMLVGYLLYNLRINTILVTLFGLISLTALLFLGDLIPVNSSLNIWIAVLFIYCFFASVLPVNILLQPRDYLSSFLLFFGVIAGYLGLFLSPQVIKAPYYHKFVSSEGYLWPMLFITVACGSISGFHSLIASGTSSKQIANERFAKRIGYGGMIAEGMVAVLAIIAAALIFNNKLISLKGISPIAIFGEGYSIITEKILVGQGKFIAITILNAFILTTLDTATRISRYLTEELFRIKSRYLSTFIIVVLSAALTFSGKWNKIWPAFGASNQLVAALALFVLTCWLLGKGKKTWFVLWPGVFMLFTTLAALIIQAIKYFLQKDFILLITVILLIALAIFMTYEVLPIIITRRKQHA
jgi:carbon starvation protein